MVLFRFADRLTAVIGRDAFREYVLGPEFDPGHSIFWDVRESEVVADFAGIFGAVQSLSVLFARYPGEVPGILLVRGAMQYGMARMLQQIADFASPVRFHVVETEAEAERILGLDPGELDAVLQAS